MENNLNSHINSNTQSISKEKGSTISKKEEQNDFTSRNNIIMDKEEYKIGIKAKEANAYAQESITAKNGIKNDYWASQGKALSIVGHSISIDNIELNKKTSAIIITTITIISVSLLVCSKKKSKKVQKAKRKIKKKNIYS